MNFLKKKDRDNASFEEGVIKTGSFDATTDKVKDFYEVEPFPNFDELENKDMLSHKIMENRFNQGLKDLVGFGSSFLEVGSGTCQLSLALALGTNNEVVAMDPTLKSLRLGQKFATRNEITNIHFLNASLFEDVIQENYFDFVWCSGVLHHTYNSKKGFQTISQWVKPGGIVFIGLYNRYGRLRTNFRQLLYFLLAKGKIAKRIIHYLDPVLRTSKSEAKRKAWFADQYLHPVERKHTIDEVLQWFDDNDIQFLGSLPSCRFATNTGGFIQFNENDRANKASRLAAQIDMLFQTYGAEGGLFIMAGRKKLLHK